MNTIWQDLRYALRTLFKTPGFAIVAMLVMALGIGANTALFTVVRAVILRPLPFPDPDRLVSLFERNVVGEGAYNVVSGGVFEEWQRRAQSFEQMALIGENGANLSGSGGQLPERIQTRLCSYNLFPLLGVQPVKGRLFTAEDDRPQASATVVLSYGLWKRRFGGDAELIGKTILLDAEPYVVIGVLPSWFEYPEAETQAWLPVYHQLRPEAMHSRGNHFFYVTARLKPGVSIAQAFSELDGIQRQIHEETPHAFTGKYASVIPLADNLVRNVKSSLYILLAAVGFVLLIACLNVANLLVARSASRRKEIAIRVALGGSRWRLLRGQIAESLLLAFAGGLLGLIIANWTTAWLLHAKQGLPRANTVHLDAQVLLFGLGIAAFSGFFAGLLPALTATRGDVLAALQETSRSAGTGVSRARLRKLLLTVEVSLTVVLLIGSGLLLRSFAELRSVSMGCATENVLTMGLSLPQAKYSNPAQVAQFFEQSLEHVRAMPGVRAAGVVTVLPGRGHFTDGSFEIEGHPALPPGQFLDAVIRAADPGYFQAMGVPLLRGRFFTDSERLEEAKAAIITESMARQFFPGEDPLEKHLTLGWSKWLGTIDRPVFEIVGIVGDVRSRVASPPEPTMYFPLYAGEFSFGSLAVRSDKDVTTLALPIQTEIARMDADLPISNVLTMEQIIGRSTADARFNAFLILAFAALALTLAAVGLFGVLSYMVSERTAEVGVRVALGAQRPDVMRLMLLDGLRPAAIGLFLGLVGGGACAQLIRSVLFGVRPLDPFVYAAVAAVVTMVAAFACVLPAWRAAQLDPMVALRNE